MGKKRNNYTIDVPGDWTLGQSQDGGSWAANSGGYESEGGGGESTPLLIQDTSVGQSGSLGDHCHSPGDTGAKHSNKKARNQLIIASILCLCFMIGECVGGYLSHSLAIMTDAAHLLSDFAGFMISLFALWFANRQPTKSMSFGYYRAEVIGAVISVLLIWILTGVLVYLAIMRCIVADYHIHADTMLITASIGVIINIILGVVLHQTGHGHSHGIGGGHTHGDTEKKAILSGEVSTAGSGSINNGDSPPRNTGHSHKKHSHNINVRAAFIHVIGDIIQSVGVLIAALVVKFQPDYQIADPICTFIFSVLVLITTLAVIRDAVHVLMEGAPKNIDYNDVKNDLLAISGVKMTHSLHIWSLTLDRAALAVHLATDQVVDQEYILQTANQMLRDTYSIYHTTIQVEQYRPAVMADCVECQGPDK